MTKNHAEGVDDGYWSECSHGNEKEIKNRSIYHIKKLLKISKKSLQNGSAPSFHSATLIFWEFAPSLRSSPKKITQILNPAMCQNFSKKYFYLFWDEAHELDYALQLLLNLKFLQSKSDVFM